MNYMSMLLYRDEEGTTQREERAWVTEKGATSYVTQECKSEDVVAGCVKFGSDVIFELEGDFA